MTAERMRDFALTVTAQGHQDALGRARALRAMVVKLSKICQRAGVPTSFAADTVAERIQAVEVRIPAMDYLRCGSLVTEAEDISRAPLDSVDASLTVLFREHERSETRARGIIKDAAAARAKAMKAADKALERSLKLARAKSTKEAHGNAVYSLWFQFTAFGVMTGLIGAFIAVRLPSESAQQQQGLLISLALGFGLPLALYVIAKCQNPGLNDWLRLMEEREFAREFPKRAEELQCVRQAAVGAADQKYKEASRASQQEIASIQGGIDRLNTLRDHIRTLRTEAEL